MFLEQLLNFELITEKCNKSIALENNKKRLKNRSKSKNESHEDHVNLPVEKSTEGITPELCMIMHDSWLQMVKSKVFDDSLITKIELCGAKAVVKASTVPSVTGIEGYIVRENSKYIYLYIWDSLKVLKVIKKGTIIIVEYLNNHFIIDLTKFGDAALRHKKGIKGTSR
jgi:RNase P/RNase MRP subunit p29